MPNFGGPHCANVIIKHPNSHHHDFAIVTESSFLFRQAQNLSSWKTEFQSMLLRKPRCWLVARIDSLYCDTDTGTGTGTDTDTGGSIMAILWSVINNIVKCFNAHNCENT